MSNRQGTLHSSTILVVLFFHREAHVLAIFATAFLDQVGLTEERVAFE
jgi:hypothetical protein